MKRLVAFRLLAAVPLLLLAAVGIFSLTYLMPGSAAAAILGDKATPERVALLEHHLGLDRPLTTQFVSWFGHALHGNLGQSFYSGFDVSMLIGQRIVPTLSVATAGICVAIVLGLAAGLAAALRPSSPIDTAVSVVTAAGLAVPGFWLGIILLLIFAVKLDLLPVLSWTPPSESVLGWLRGLILPALSVGLAGSATIARMARISMLEALESPFVLTLRAMGTPQRTIVLRYALKNAMIPVITVTAGEFMVMIGSSLVVEKVFTIPGLGALMVDAVTRHDIPIVQGVTILMVILMVITYLVIDIVYAFLNPRARPS